jgi:hypothetical protein
MTNTRNKFSPPFTSVDASRFFHSKRKKKSLSALVWVRVGHNSALNCTLFTFYLHIYGNWNAMLRIQNKCNFELQRKNRFFLAFHHDHELLNCAIEFARPTLQSIAIFSIAILYRDLIRRWRSVKGSALTNSTVVIFSGFVVKSWMKSFQFASLKNFLCNCKRLKHIFSMEISWKKLLNVS